MFSPRRPRRPPPSRRERARGIALISVLWLIALLTLLATAAATLTTTQRRSGASAIETAELEALADSAIQIVLLRMIAPLPRAPTWPVGAATLLQLPNGAASVTLEPEAWRVDLNASDDEHLLAAFDTRGWQAEPARSMVARIRDWADADDATRPGGAELRDYRQRGLRYGPRNAPFESVNELRQVLGGENVDDALLDAFTVYTHRPTPLDPNTPPPNGDQPTFAGEVVRIRACVQRERGERCRVAIVRLTGNRQTPLQVFAWATHG